VGDKFLAGALGMLNAVRTLRTYLPALSLLVLLSGCQGGSNPPSSAGATAAQQQQVDTVQQELELIPPPSKTRYMAVRTLSNWENPYITVQADMLTLHVLLADANTSSMGVGGMTRPLAARRRDLTVRVDDLPAALSAVPQNAWPYGRVVAIEEAHDTPAKARPQVRRTMEIVMQKLSTLGVVVYEWPEAGISAR
jgi:hypothetical protein